MKLCVAGSMHKDTVACRHPDSGFQSLGWQQNSGRRAMPAGPCCVCNGLQTQDLPPLHALSAMIGLNTIARRHVSQLPGSYH